MESKQQTSTQLFRIWKSFAFASLVLATQLYAQTQPSITAQPVSRTNNANTTATFNVIATGSLPLSYQWHKNGNPLSVGEKISSVTATNLSIINVLGPEAGDYSVVITNSYGSVTSLVATLTVIDPLITTQFTNQNLNIGQTVTLNVGAAGTSPLNYQWRLNGTNLTITTTSSLTLTNVQRTNAGFYDVIVSNMFGSVTSSPALLTVNLVTLDTLNSSVGGQIDAIAVQPDGRILIGGSFTNVGGQLRNRIARLNTNGTLDTTFNPGANNKVFSLAVQPDGKILVGGWFTTLAGQSRVYIGRLHPDGSADMTFNPGATGIGSLPGVFSLALQADGKILVSGSYRMLAGHNQTNIGRLYPDGSADVSFNASANDIVYPIAVQTDGKIVLGGNLTTLCGQPRHHIGRLHADGTLDTNFDPGVNTLPLTMAVQPDGKILVGGDFDTMGGEPCTNLGRLNPDGTLDVSFNVPATGPSGIVRVLAIQTDGKILAGGSFSFLNGYPRNRLGRLNPDGSVDPTFAPSANDIVYAMALQKDGKILVGGDLTTLDGAARAYFGRLNNTDPALENLTFDGTNITWLRTGTGPEVWRTTFDVSTNGADWINLGPGQRINGGWQIQALDLPLDTGIRARGFLTGSRYTGSFSFIETKIGPPAILVNDSNFGFTSNQFGFNFTGTPGQSVIVEGSTNLLDWTPLQTNTLAPTPLYFIDPQTIPWRFYRLRTP